MKCFIHQPVDAVGVCRVCGRALCHDCTAEVSDVLCCKGRCEGIAKLPEHSASTPSPTARVFRRLFILGGAILALDNVVPDTRLVGKALHDWLSTGGTERLVSYFDLGLLDFRLGAVNFGLNITLCCLAQFVLLTLAVFRPRRWVFITGALLAIWQTLLDVVFQNSEVQPLLIPLVLVYLARALAFVGFWIMWPNPQGGANGRRAFRSEPNRTPAAPAPRRSP